MNNDPFGDEELQFPVKCHYRIIAENVSGIEIEISDALTRLNISEKVKAGNQSKGGKYLTFYIDLHIESREEMDSVDKTLRAIAGVKMVL